MPNRTRVNQLARCQPNKPAMLSCRRPARTRLSKVLALCLWVIYPSLATAADSLDQDLVYQGLLRDTLGQSPELARAELQVRADTQRVSQAGALPDPTLTVGWQNDGLIPGASDMGLTWPVLMASQALPYPGKRALREQVVAGAVQVNEARTGRIRLSLRAQLQRAFVGLLVVRAQLRLLAEQGALWRQAEATARLRLSTPQGSQVDVLRAQLELTRLGQTEASLRSEERALQLRINRLAGRALQAAVATETNLEAVALSTAPSNSQAEAERVCPELTAARLAAQQASKQLQLAKLDKMPDFSASAGLMPRLGGAPMWQVSLGISLPLWSATKQERAVQGSELEVDAARRAEAEVRQVLALRTEERLEQRALARHLALTYQQVVLVQSEAMLRAALLQYATGRATFATVLEAVNGLYADRGAWLAQVAAAHAADIALKEASLEPAAGIGVSAAMAGGAMPGAGAVSRSAAPTAAAPVSGTAPPSGGGSGMSSM